MPGRFALAAAGAAVLLLVAGACPASNCAGTSTGLVPLTDLGPGLYLGQFEGGLYPNVDFYSGLIYRAMGFPTNMFTVLFAMGRLPGWIAHWKEMMESPKTKIGRPRQIYTGPTENPYVPVEQRD